MTDLSALVRRVEGATGPDRGLDGLIARDVEGWVPHFDLDGDDLLDWPDMGGHWHRPKTHPKRGECKARSDSYPGFESECPSYTSSLDAAVSFVERVLPGRDYIVRSRRKHPFKGEFPFEAVIWGPGTLSDVAGSRSGFHHAPALALILDVLLELANPHE